ncbi:MAG TPA: CocE/NonD family hydrolase, partial [Caulobacteraceae bacterium]
MRGWRAWVGGIAAIVGSAALAQAAPARADGVSATSPTIEAADGVRLAADVVVPAGPAGARHAAVLVMSPYGRASRLSQGAIHAFAAAGLAVVLVDTRGAGASQGHATAIFSREERRDIETVLRWI